MSILITGVAGFVGVNLAQALLARGERVVGFDNLSRGSEANLAPIRENSAFRFSVVHLDNLDRYREILRSEHESDPITEVWHMAANSDIPGGIADSDVDLRDTFLTTYNTLVLMRELQIPTIAFASSSAVYGDLGGRQLNEDVGPLFPISNYGAMKLASEAAISAALESYLQRALIFRFPNVLGVPATHGVILDFVRKLKATPMRLDVLGNGTQQKSYMHVEELVDAMLFISERSSDVLSFFNIGAMDKGVTVRFIAEAVRDRLSPKASIAFGAGEKGWIGDVPRFTYSVDKLAALGWRPRFGSAETVRRAIDQIVEQEGYP